MDDGSQEIHLHVLIYGRGDLHRQKHKFGKHILYSILMEFIACPICLNIYFASTISLFLVSSLIPLRKW